MKLSKVMTMSHVLTMAMCAVVFGLSLSAQASPEAAAEASEAVAKAPVTDMVAMSKNLAIALTMGCGSFATALAVGKIGVAAMGAALADRSLMILLLTEAVEDMLGAEVTAHRMAAIPPYVTIVQDIWGPRGNRRSLQELIGEAVGVKIARNDGDEA